MAVKVKSASQSADKFVERGAAASKDYESGVRGSGQDWQANALAAKETFAAGVQAAITDGRFEKGVEKAGAAKFEKKALDVGLRRFPEGIRVAKSDFQQNVEPFLEVVRAMTLSPRRMRGDPANWRRSQEVGMALRAKKLAG